MKRLRAKLKGFEDLWKPFSTVFGVLSAMGSVFALISGVLAPSFYVEYHLLDEVPISLIAHGFKKEIDTSQIPADVRGLRLKVVNDSRDKEVKNISVIVNGAITRIDFVQTSFGEAISTMPTLPASSVQTISFEAGDLRPRSERVIFVGGQFGAFFDPSIEVRSATGLAAVREAREVSGIELFVADNLEWLLALILLLLAISLLVPLSFRPTARNKQDQSSQTNQGMPASS